MIDTSRYTNCIFFWSFFWKCSRRYVCSKSMRANVENREKPKMPMERLLLVKGGMWVSEGVREWVSERVRVPQHWGGDKWNQDANGVWVCLGSGTSAKWKWEWASEWVKKVPSEWRVKCEGVSSSRPDYIPNVPEPGFLSNKKQQKLFRRNKSLIILLCRPKMHN
jgi:hypothetical protein